MTASAPSSQGRPPDPLLAVDGLCLGAAGGRLPLVHDVHLHVERGEMVGLVGESGAGKSLTLSAVLDLLPSGVVVTAGQIRWMGRDLATRTPSARAQLRGRAIGAVFQDSRAALDPCFTIGAQLTETLRALTGLRSAAELRAQAVALLHQVALPDASERLASYPHQLSGGQRQRVLIALALAGSPALLLADEPTSALDVTVQAEILDLLARLRQDLGLAVLLVTHDLAVVASCCDRVVVLHQGRVVEVGPVGSVLTSPQHQYTVTLLAHRVPFERALSAATPGEVGG